MASWGKELSSDLGRLETEIQEKGKTPIFRKRGADEVKAARSHRKLRGGRKGAVLVREATRRKKTSVEDGARRSPNQINKRGF